jgi:hypothetical protein
MNSQIHCDLEIATATRLARLECSQVQHVSYGPHEKIGMFSEPGIA